MGTADLYWWLTDFVINLANILGLTYMETNGLIFGVAFPVYTLAMLIVGVLRRM
tara:strand:+ start:213 stop:374 length:162 start_codon:yes stop_codon:yes gene_type:complete